jgi:hypothetical protein
MLVTAHPSQVAAIEELAGEYSFFAARIGTTGGDRLEINVYRRTLDLRSAGQPAQALGLGPGSHPPRRGNGMTRRLYQGVEGEFDAIKRDLQWINCPTFGASFHPKVG